MRRLLLCLGIAALAHASPARAQTPVPVTCVSGCSGGGGGAAGASGAPGATGTSAQYVQGVPNGTAVSVSGSVNVGNFPATQPVSGSVSVGNFPATQPVSGNIADSNSAAFQGVVAITPGTTTTAQRSVGYICTSAGNITLTLADASTLTLPIQVASGQFQTLPFAVTNITLASGTAGTFWGLK